MAWLLPPLRPGPPTDRIRPRLRQARGGNSCPLSPESSLRTARGTLGVKPSRMARVSMASACGIGMEPASLQRRRFARTRPLGWHQAFRLAGTRVRALFGRELEGRPVRQASAGTFGLPGDRRHERLELRNPQPILTLQNVPSMTWRIVDVSLSGAATAAAARDLSSVLRRLASDPVQLYRIRFKYLTV
jgi:hypothetical protein